MILDSIDNINHHSNQVSFSKGYLFQERMEFYFLR